jgi:hypothetical protein
VVTTSTPSGNDGLHTIDDVQGVFPLAHDHDAAHDVALAVVVGNAPPHLRTQGHGGDVLDRDRGAVLGLEDQLLQIGQRLHIATTAHHVLAA